MHPMHNEHFSIAAVPDVDPPPRDETVPTTAVHGVPRAHAGAPRALPVVMRTEELLCSWYSKRWRRKEKLARQNGDGAPEVRFSNGIYKRAYLVFIRVFGVRNLKRVPKVEDSTDLMSCGMWILSEEPLYVLPVRIYEDALMMSGDQFVSTFSLFLL